LWWKASYVVSTERLEFLKQTNEINWVVVVNSITCGEHRETWVSFRSVVPLHWAPLEFILLSLLEPIAEPISPPLLWCMDLIFGFSFVVSLAQQSLSYILTRDTRVKLSYTCLMGYAQQFCSSVKCSIYAGFFISIAHSFSYPAVYKFPDFAFSFFSVFLAFCRLSVVCNTSNVWCSLVYI